jgi:hypothetical protein
MGIRRGGCPVRLPSSAREVGRGGPRGSLAHGARRPRWGQPREGARHLRSPRHPDGAYPNGSCSVSLFYARNRATPRSIARIVRTVRAGWPRRVLRPPSAPTIDRSGGRIDRENRRRPRHRPPDICPFCGNFVSYPPRAVDAVDGLQTLHFFCSLGFRVGLPATQPAATSGWARLAGLLASYPTFEGPRNHVIPLAQDRPRPCHLPLRSLEMMRSARRGCFRTDHRPHRPRLREPRRLRGLSAVDGACLRRPSTRLHRPRRSERCPRS